MLSRKVIAVVVAIVALAPASWAARRKMFPMNVPAAGAKTVAFDVQEGDFVVRGDPSVNEVQMRVSIDRYWLFKLGEEGILKKLIQVDGEGTGALTIRTRIEPSWRNWMRAEYPIDFEIVVPAGANLQVHDTSGKIVITEMRGQVAVEDTSGTLEVQSVAGPVRIEKESGDIRVIDVAGAVTIGSKSGKLHVDRVGTLEILRSSGNVEVMDAASARIENKDGNITVNGVKGALIIDDDSGEIQVRNAGGEVAIHDTSGQIRTVQTGPLTVDDTSGDLTVERAASLTIRSKESGAVKVKNVSGKVEAPETVAVKRQ